MICHIREKGLIQNVTVKIKKNQQKIAIINGQAWYHTPAQDSFFHSFLLPQSLKSGFGGERDSPSVAYFYLKSFNKRLMWKIVPRKPLFELCFPSKQRDRIAEFNWEVPMNSFGNHVYSEPSREINKYEIGVIIQ
jgi:hypothetical protein